MPRPHACRVLIVLPQRDFDPSEVAVTWKILSGEGHRVNFATPDARPASADPLMLAGEGLDLWGRVPHLRKIKLLGLLLRANADARRAYAQMQNSAAFLHPVAYTNLAVAGYDGLVLPGGHWARGMRRYLEDPALQRVPHRKVRAVGPKNHGSDLDARESRLVDHEVLWACLGSGLLSNLHGIKLGTSWLPQRSG